MQRLQRLLGHLGPSHQQPQVQRIPVAGSSASWTYSSVGKERTVVLEVKDDNGNSAMAEVFVFGAHVRKWQESGKPPAIFMSDTAKLDASTAIRGGIPIVFPQFGGHGPMRSHGFARRVHWRVAEGGSNTSVQKSQVSNGVSVTFVLEPNATTKAMWPYEFRFEYTVTLTGATNSRLTTSWNVSNTGTAPFSFSCCSHSYLRVSAVGDVSVRGLEDLPYCAKTNGAKWNYEKSGPRTIEGASDDIYFDSPNEQILHDPGYGRDIIIRKQGFPDTVLWTPHLKGAQKMGDLSTEQWADFLCVEPGVVSNPVHLDPGQSWKGIVSHTVRYL
mmetsp:Transcript_3197/g.3817  ORF Transcript_3197/g.3817 Transcript_3197/m.3817 type:complete len:329 (+) Transcript_3197:21-1007(+)